MCQTRMTCIHETHTLKTPSASYGNIGVKYSGWNFMKLYMRKNKRAPNLINMVIVFTSELCLSPHIAISAINSISPIADTLSWQCNAGVVCSWVRLKSKIVYRKKHNLGQCLMWKKDYIDLLHNITHIRALIKLTQSVRHRTYCTQATISWNVDVVQIFGHGDTSHPKQFTCIVRPHTRLRRTGWNVLQ